MAVKITIENETDSNFELQGEEVNQGHWAHQGPAWGISPHTSASFQCEPFFWPIGCQGSVKYRYKNEEFSLIFNHTSSREGNDPYSETMPASMKADHRGDNESVIWTISKR